MLMAGKSGCAVGAVLAPKQHLQTVIRALDERHWRKKGVRVSNVDDEEGFLAVAVAPSGARALDAHCEQGASDEVLQGSDASLQVPTSLADLLRDGAVRWATGLRAGASASAAPATWEAAGGASARFTYAELFAGIGGFRLALDPLGGRCVFASEIDSFAAATYARNFGEHPAGDITEVETEALPPHDLLSAGFPCQSFSRTGKQHGLGDSRGDLFFEIVRVAQKGKPKVMSPCKPVHPPTYPGTDGPTDRPTDRPTHSPTVSPAHRPSNTTNTANANANADTNASANVNANEIRTRMLTSTPPTPPIPPTPTPTPPIPTPPSTPTPTPPSLLPLLLALHPA